ncbi:response regulator [Lachnospiraceae bacterium]|nr:response regulator [Lachnospiraceae bacterium]
MYHCHIHFYMLGQQSRIFDIIKETPPFEHFSHEYMESSKPQESMAAKADVIFANLQTMDAGEAVRALIQMKSEKAELILLAEKEQMEALTEDFSEIKDIWTLPLLEEEIRFRFLRWRQTFQMSKDFWQINHFFEATINHVPNLVWYKDKNGIHEKVNDSFCKTVNKTRQQVEGRGHAYIWDVEQDDPVCIESEREVMESGKTRVSEEIIQTGAGLRTLMTYKSPLYDLDGSVMGTVGVAIDVTKERAYEQEIIQKSQMLEKLFTSIDCGVMLHSLDGKHVLSINRAALGILGYGSLEEMMADGFDMVASTVLEEDKDKLRGCIMELEKEGDTVSTQYRVRHKNGQLLHIMGSIKLVEENGELFYQRFLLDCTEQRLQEQRNEKQQEELIRALSIDYNIVCCFDLDLDLGISLRNNEEGRAFVPGSKGRISFQESMERYIQEFVYEDDQEMLRALVSSENLRKELEQKKQYYVNYRAIVQGRTKYYQLKAVRTGTWKGQHGIVLGIRCVDEETRNEMEKKTLLENALMQAKRASKAKSLFLSNMSHDIRTPMNAIVGFTALAITHVEEKEQVEEYLKKIMTSGNHLLSLINDVLDMSRIESGKMHLDEKPCSLPDILHGLRSILQADIHAKNLDLYIDAVDILDEDIYCDKLRLNQVLLNLLSNAVKYTTSGGMVTMRIIQKGGAPNGYANYEFNIRDTGIGMSEEFVAHIFEPFEREKSSTASKIQGTGLGMAITKNIVDMMNGTIEVKSEQGSGTEVRVCFTFRLNTDAKEPEDIPELKNCRALVIDDDFNTCDSVTYMLTQIGMRAEWTLSGKEALLRTHQAVARGDNYTVYVIDWMLPDMNGIEVTRRIRKETGEDVPIILLTAYDWLEIEEEAKEAGVTAFCSKPLFYSELHRCLHSIVDVEGEEREDGGETSKKRHTGRILLAEDNELNQEIAKAILEDAGFSVEVAENGKIAVDMLKKSQPGYYQLVLMDVRMPEMNGYEATKAIRSLENRELSAIPIFAMTANAFEEDKKEALACGMNGHLAKPIEVEVLFNTLDQILK